ncbi:MAG: hypothetical protein IPP50_15230 [Piscinibacter sp.]|nr:hypothetical protein [Piscinibacter sp.]
MAKPNYSFEKRQRELAKKKKKEEKAKEKAERKTGPGQSPEGEAGGGDELSPAQPNPEAG